MRPEELKMLLHSLLPNWEDEVVEFKRGGKGFSTGEVDEYLCVDTSRSGLRNGECPHGKGDQFIQ